MSESLTNLVIHPLSPERWADLETLFGPRGAYAGCWCMWWRLPRAEFTRLQGAGTHAALKTVVDSGAPTGLLAYQDGQPIGWIAVAPREDYSSLERSRTLKRVDDQPVWSITCFFINRKVRRRGLTAALIAAACAHAARQGARIIEAYPVETGEKAPPVSTYMGKITTFLRAGFVEVARFSPRQPILRKTLSEAD